MNRIFIHSLLLALLAPAAGCQLPTMDKLATAPRPGSSDAAFFAELTPKAKAELCLATADTMFKKAGNDSEALALYEKAIQNGVPRSQVSRRLAILYDRQKDYPRALEQYQQLLQHHPKDADLLNDVGYCYYNQGKWAEAEKFLRQATALNAKHARAWINLGMTLAQMSRTAESLEAFAKVVSPAEAQCNLAFILTTQHKWEEARAAYRQALELEDLPLARAALMKLEKAG